MHYMSQAVLRQQLKPQLEAQKLSTVCTLMHDEEILHITPTCQFFIFPLSLLPSLSSCYITVTILHCVFIRRRSLRWEFPIT